MSISSCFENLSNKTQLKIKIQFDIDNFDNFKIFSLWAHWLDRAEYDAVFPTISDSKYRDNCQKIEKLTAFILSLGDVFVLEKQTNVVKYLKYKDKYIAQYIYDYNEESDYFIIPYLNVIYQNRFDYCAILYYTDISKIINILNYIDIIELKEIK